MAINADNEQILKTPRNMQIIFAKCLGLIFLVPGLLVFIAPNSDPDPLFSIVVLLFISIGLLIFFLPERYRTYLRFDKASNLLTITARGKKTQVVSLTGAISLISKTELYGVGSATHFLILHKDQGQAVVCQEVCYAWASHWVAFTERLASITGLPMTRERWADDYNGKMHLITPQARKEAHKRIVFALLPVALPFIGAFAYKMDPTRSAFIMFGLATVILGNSSVIIYYLLNKSKMIDRDEIKSYLFVSAISINIKMTLFYVGYSFALNGATLPGIIQ